MQRITGYISPQYYGVIQTQPIHQCDVDDWSPRDGFLESSAGIFETSPGESRNQQMGETILDGVPWLGTQHARESLLRLYPYEQWSSKMWNRKVLRKNRVVIMLYLAIAIFDSWRRRTQDILTWSTPSRSGAIRKSEVVLQFIISKTILYLYFCLYLQVPSRVGSLCNLKSSSQLQTSLNAIRRY